MKKTLLVLLGLPRSGTTVATAMLDVHPEITAWFEPCNNRKNINPKPLQSFSDFREQYESFFGVNVEYQQILMFKETATNQNTINWSSETIENISIAGDVNVKVIWLVRDIHHVYLSRVHTANEHWGHVDMKVEIASFKAFVNYAFYGFQKIEAIVDRYDSCVFSYEGLVLDTENLLKQVMKFIGVKLHSNQLQYHRYFNKKKSAGDPEVTTNPKPVTSDRICQKNEEWKKYSEIFIESLDDVELLKYKKMIGLVEKIKSQGFVLRCKD